MSAYLMMHLGALLGWCTHPLLWAIYSPWRWLFYLGITASQESGGNPAVAGDNGESLGMLQFHKPTRAGLGMSDEKALSPFWSGYYGAVYVSEALTADWKWWYALRLPYYGAGAIRVLWRGGIGSADDWKQGMDPTYAGAAFWPAYWRWVTVPVLLTVVFFYGLYTKGDKILIGYKTGRGVRT